MKKTMSREVAVILYNLMAKMNFSHLSEETLEVVMSNYMALGKEAEHCTKMVDELRKRLFDGVDEAELKEYGEKSQEMNEAELEKAFPAIFPLAIKFNKVYASIYSKDVEVEITEVDKSEFVKGVTKGTPNLVAGILNNFEIMYKKEEDDFSELDDLLK